MSKDKLDFSVRKTTIENFGDILKLRKESLLELNSVDYSIEQLEALHNNELETSNIKEEDLKNDALALLHFHSLKENTDDISSIVAEIEDKIIGYAFISDLDIVTKSQVVYELFVHPEYIRQGVGTKLLQTLEEDAFYRGCKIIYIYAFTTAEPFYQANNYRTIEITSFFRKGICIPMIYIEKWLIVPLETDKFFWELSNQVIRAFNFITTGIERINRESF